MRKVYGQSQTIECPFCSSQCTTKNAQGLPVCHRHSQTELNLKCACGDWLDITEGKYGTFFMCMKCGPVSWRKAMEINDCPLRSFEDL